jgi:hypothetical protein
MLEIKITIPDDADIRYQNTLLEDHLRLFGFVRENAPRDTPVVCEIVQTEMDFDVTVPDVVEAVSQEEPVDSRPARKTRLTKPKATANISAAPEHRVDPSVEEQDAEDEKAEEVIVKNTDVPTEEMLRKAINGHVEKFSLAATIDVAKVLLVDKIGEPPAGKVWNVSTVTAGGPELLAKVIAVWNEATALASPYGSAR